MSLDAALSQIDKMFGDGTIRRLGDDAVTPIEVIPTGSIALDKALGCGGYPRGRIVEIFGPESSGKSSLCLHAAANAQKAGGNVVYIDVEHSLDPTYAKAIGVDIDNLIITQPSTGEQALEIVDAVTKTGEVALVIIDSVAALVPRAELDGDMGDSHVGLHARLMSQAMRRLTGVLDQTKTCSIWVNQLREKIGTMGYGPNETTTGGRALRFYASQRLDVRRISTVKQGDEAVANQTRIKVVKNKLAPPHKQCEVEIEYGVGISRPAELINLGSQLGIVKKSGAWYSYQGSNIGQGKPKAAEWLLEHPDEAAIIETAIREGL